MPRALRNYDATRLDRRGDHCGNLTPGRESALEIANGEHMSRDPGRELRNKRPLVGSLQVTDAAASSLKLRAKIMMFRLCDCSLGGSLMVQRIGGSSAAKLGRDRDGRERTPDLQALINVDETNCACSLGLAAKWQKRSVSCC